MLNYPPRETHQYRFPFRSLFILLQAIIFHTSYAQKTNEGQPNKAYSETITLADNLLIAGEYLQAINEYEKAWNLNQRQKYPEKKIDQIHKTLVNTPLSKMLFEKSINQGDSCFLVNDFKKANAGYYDALRLDPSAQYPKDQLSRISALFTDPENDTRYRIVLIHAGKAYDRAKYDKAINYFQHALFIKPSEKWLEKKIEETTALKDKNAAAMDPYTKYLLESDNLLEQKQWTEARAGYAKASTLRPKEKYTAAKIALIDHLQHFTKTGERTYNSLIVDADKFYRLQDYVNAGIYYQEALSLKPDEQYPKSMLKKLDHLNQQANTSYPNYDEAVTNADILSLAGDNEAALIGYQRCNTITPGDNYIKSRILELTKATKTENNNGNREAYLSAISKGDRSLAAKNYSKALSEFLYAAWLKPDELYPKTKIEEVQNLINLAKSNQAEKPQANTSAERIISAEDNPIVVVPEPSFIKQKTPGETQVPKTAKIDQYVIFQNAQNLTYNTLILSADTAFDKKDYTAAINNYKSALEIKPAEKYPCDRIKTSNTLLAEVNALQQTYEKHIAEADKSFSLRNYPASLLAYQSALKIYPDKQYPTDQINKINSIVENQNEDLVSSKITEAAPAINQQNENKAQLFDMHIASNEQKPDAKPEKAKPVIAKPLINQPNAEQESYNKAIAFADNAFADMNYSHALNGYNAALKIKPLEKYPKEKIAAVNLILDQENALQDTYKKTILKADKAFTAKDYTKALISYQSALEQNPVPKYPNERIAAIKIILGQQNALQTNYDKSIAAADHLFDEKRYTDAVTGYQKALKLKPDETYPREKITVINSLIGETKLTREKYSRAISEADQAFTAKKYNEALLIYQAALEITPGETYPRQRIAAINLVLGQQKARLDKYNAFIANADQAFNDKDYNTSITNYKSAIGLNANETYPKEQIETINAILSQQKVVQESYNKVIMVAEKAFAAKDYQSAISGFQSALVYKPEENYPQERITVISGIIALDKEKLEKQYADCISQAEVFFADQDLQASQKAYKMASMLKPNEAYPREKYNQIADISIAKAKATNDAYDGAIAEADNAYKSLVMDKAVLFYKKALDIKPGEVYPGQMIARIRKFMIENSVVEITGESFILKNDSERRFRFKPVEANLRKNNYLVIRACISGKSQPKLYINYGSENMKNGGVVLKNINSELLNDFVINISIQDKWFREDNDWLSLYSENGDLVVASIRISQGK